jgi:flagellar basal body-associated protein FliL
VADKDEAAPEQEAAPQPAGEVKATGGRAFNSFSLMVMAVTAALYAGVVFASAGITHAVVIPKLSTYLAVREARAILATELKGEPPQPFGQIYLIEDLVVNPFGSGGLRYALVSVGLESMNPKVIEELEARDAQIKDVLIQIFGSKTIEQLADVRTREQIRGEVKGRIDDVLPEEGLDAVYFVNFVLQ